MLTLRVNKVEYKGIIFTLLKKNYMDYSWEIEQLKDGERYIVPEGDYGKAEIWLKNGYYFLFSIPHFGGEPMYEDHYTCNGINAMIEKINSWT